MQKKKLKTLVEVWYKSSERVRPDTIRSIADSIREGLPVESACTIAGISPGTYKLWEAAGRDFIELGPGETYHGNRHVRRNEEHAEFYLRLEQAKALYQQKVIRRSLDTDAYSPNWMRDMSILERRFRKDWSRTPQDMDLREDLPNPNSTTEKYL